MSSEPVPEQAGEWAVRLQFLEEARAYFDAIETGILGLGSHGLDRSRFDRILRAAHSLKGGAAMMGFAVLSDLAHRLEDGLKVLQVHPERADASTETGILTAIDHMRLIAHHHRQRQGIPENWLTEQVHLNIASLQTQLGELETGDTAQLLSAEAGGDMRVLMFETEVDSCLQRLEGVVAHPEQPCLREEFLIASQELGALGEMLDLPAFTTLCSALAEGFESIPVEHKSQVLDLATAALQVWRRSQALVMVQQFDLLPATWERVDPPVAPANSSGSLESLPPAPSAPLPSAPLPIIESPERSADPAATMRVSVRHLDQLGELFGELTTERNGLTPRLQRMRELVRLLKQRVGSLGEINSRLRSTYDHVASGVGDVRIPVAAGNGSPSRLFQVSAPEPLPGDFDRLEMDRYGELHLLAQEVMEAVVQIDEVTADIDTSLQDTEGTARQLTRTSRQMQTQLTQVRMQPLSDLTDRFPRALRELSLTYGKQVDLRVRGGATLFERSMLETLAEPLLHLIRNAFDHGIEAPDIRLQRGKSPKGVIEINATHRGNRTLLTIQDDGAGIPLDKVRAKALQMGFSDSDLAAASPTDLLDLIFEPGFSTAAQVTDLSGRGVGMDVVRTKLQQVGGQVQVETREGVGTLFTLTVPLSLTVMRVLLVESKGLLLAVPANAVEELLIPEGLQSGTPDAAYFAWEDYQVPLIRLSQWFHFARPQPRLETDETPIIDQATVLLVVEGDRPYGLQVDRYWRELEVTLRPVEGGMPLPPGLPTCTILADGRIVPLVDLSALLSWIETQGSPSRLAQPTVALTSPSQKTVLVVEDSINVRRFLAMTLERAGFRVEQARDGQDALDQLRAGVRADAVICDVEMPRLDGFGFLAQVRADPTQTGIPIIMLTSRSGDKHRRLAATLGATAYFGKPFQEQDLLQTLAGLVPTAPLPSGSLAVER